MEPTDTRCRRLGLEMANPAMRIVCFAVLIAFTSSCKKDTSSPGEPGQEVWVTRQQAEIPWPGLANSDWPIRLHDPQHTGRSRYRGPTAGELEWRFDAGREVYAAPVIDEDGTILVSTLGNGMLSVSPLGVQKWQAINGGDDDGPVISCDGSIYTLTAMDLWSYDRNGNMNWRYPFLARAGGISPMAPTISKDGETIFVADSSLYAIGKNGVLRWVMKPDSTDMVGTIPALSPDGAMIFVSGMKALYAVDTSGTLKWKFTAECSVASVDNDGNIYFTTSGGMVYSLSPAGTVRWLVYGPRLSNLYHRMCPVIGWDGSIYMAGGSSIYAFDYGGNLKWSYDVPPFCDIESPPAIDHDGTLYIGFATGRTPADSTNFVALSASGKVIFHVGLRNPDGTLPDIDSSPAISAEGKLYVGSDRPYGHYLFKVR